MSTRERLAELRKEIASGYLRHCGECNGACCTAELEDEFIAFDWEADELNKPGDSSGKNRFPFRSGRCTFSGDHACSLSIDKRPLDCLTYPVYPQIAFNDKDEKTLTGLFVREGCHKLNEIKSDEALLGMIRTFWECQITQIDNASIKQWQRELAR